MNKEKTLFWITIISALIVLIIAASLSVFISKEKNDIELKLNRSIFNKKPSGMAAWHKVLSDSGVDVALWRNSFHGLTSIEKEKATMVIISPEFAANNTYVFTQKDIENILNWVRVGNTLIFVDDFNRTSSRDFLSKLNLQLADKFDKEDKAKDMDKDKDKEKDLKDLGTYFDEISQDLYTDEKTLYDISEIDEFNYKVNTISSTSTVRLKDKFIQPIIEDDEGIILGKRDYGKGKVYVLTIPDLMDNSTLYEEEDNYQFFTNLVLVDHKKIYINEYVHGFVKSENLMSYYSETLLNPLSKQFLLLMIILLWSVSRRFGKPRPLYDDDRKTNIIYVNAMGNLYNLAGLTGTALTPIYNQFKIALCKELRIDINTTPQELFRVIRNTYSNTQSEDLVSIINECEIAMHSNEISKEDMVNLCKRLNKYRLKGSRYAKRS
ncbi:MAG: DUF4350 domain-containing protein [Cyanobacteriota bacterium]